MLSFASGNNGGDGWAIARLLAKEDYHIIAINVSEKSHYSPDCDINRKRTEQISKTSPNLSISPFSTNLKFDKNTLIIDAIFGIGLSKPITGFYAEVIQFINQLNAIVVAVDVPSGLYVDTHTPKTNISISATYTIIFQFLKQAFVLAENENRGNCHVADIGLIVRKYSSAGKIDNPSIRFTIYKNEKLLHIKAKKARAY